MGNAIAELTNYMGLDNATTIVEFLTYLSLSERKLSFQ